MKKYFLFICCCAFTTFLSGQPIDVLQLKKQKYYTEESVFYKDSAFTVKEKVLYDEPLTADEEHYYVLILDFKDILKARRKKSIDLIKDSSFIQSDYGFFSPWDHWGEQASISGHVKIIAWSATQIRLSLDIVVTDNRRNKTLIYKGTRVFLKTKRPLLSEIIKKLPTI
ncbi:MAG: hypothetical protein ACHQEB_03755 [Chitinophagales bacterium]